MQTSEFATDVAVRFEDVYKAFVARGGGNNEPVLALSDINFDARPGEFISLVGPSGCGKSACLNMLAGLPTASPGAALHTGQAVRGVVPAVCYVTPGAP